MEPTKDELAQLELCIPDLERRIVDTTSRVACEAGAFGSLQCFILWSRRSRTNKSAQKSSITT